MLPPIWQKPAHDLLHAVSVETWSHDHVPLKNHAIDRISLFKHNRLIAMNFIRPFAINDGCGARTETKYHPKVDISSQSGNCPETMPLKRSLP